MESDPSTERLAVSCAKDSDQVDQWTSFMTLRARAGKSLHPCKVGMEDSMFTKRDGTKVSIV